MMTQNLHPKVKWRLKLCTNLFSREIWCKHKKIRFLQVIEGLHWSSDEEGNIRKLVSRWKARMITDKMQTELMFFLSFYFQSILFCSLCSRPHICFCWKPRKSVSVPKSVIVWVVWLGERVSSNLWTLCHIPAASRGPAGVIYLTCH